MDLYVGGAEHAVLHLLYSRFWHKVLFDRGHVSTVEPFQRLVNQGMILGEVEFTGYVLGDGGNEQNRRYVSVRDLKAGVDEEGVATRVVEKTGEVATPSHFPSNRSRKRVIPSF